MPYLLIPLLQITCIIHALRSGRDRTWIYILALLPGVGVVAYLVVEILPGLWHSRTGRGLQQQAIRHLDPSHDVRRRREALEEADTVDNHRLLAEALAEAGEFKQAVDVYRGTLTGIHADDPGMLLGMAKAAFAAGLFDESLRTVLRLGETNPRYQPVDAQLLYARTLEALGRDGDAAQEYQQLVTHAPGEEVRCRYALLLQRRGRALEALGLFKEILSRSKRAPGHYRRQEREWIDIARREVAG
jgi:hypothetical protein